jgi:hypothetical protein
VITSRESVSAIGEWAKQSASSIGDLIETVGKVILRAGPFQNPCDACQAKNIRDAEQDIDDFKDRQSARDEKVKQAFERASGPEKIGSAHLAGQRHPKTGVPFDAKRFPDFKAAGVVNAEVQITQTGTRAGDFKAANEAARFKETPRGMTWHHHQDGTTMQLVPRDIHMQTGHTGGFSQ